MFVLQSTLGHRKPLAARFFTRTTICLRDKSDKNIPFISYKFHVNVKKKNMYPFFFLLTHIYIFLSHRWICSCFLQLFYQRSSEAAWLSKVRGINISCWVLTGTFPQCYTGLMHFLDHFKRIHTPTTNFIVFFLSGYYRMDKNEVKGRGWLLCWRFSSQI